jgi:putative transposase
MPQSLVKVYTHLVFSTKDRRPDLTDFHRSKLHEYFGGILNGLDSPPIEINSVTDHVHLLFLLPRTHSIATVVGELKEHSNKWLKQTFDGFSRFYWQRGYSMFSVSLSQTEKVRAYVRNQQARHRKQSFQDELRQLLTKHSVEYDERYVWD